MWYQIASATAGRLADYPQSVFDKCFAVRGFGGSRPMCTSDTWHRLSESCKWPVGDRHVILDHPRPCGGTGHLGRRAEAACRDALVACHLEGLSYADAAQRLGWPLDTLKKPLGRARQLLRQRLRRGGVDMSLLALCVSLSEQASAAVPRVLVQATLRCASAAAAPARVASLAEGALRTLAVAKLKGATIAIFATAFLSLAAALALRTPTPNAADESRPVAAVPVADPQAKPIGGAVMAGDPNQQLAEDERLFRATLKIEDKALLDFFRTLALSAAEESRIQQLIRQLDARASTDRDKATALLIAEGHRAVPLLQAARPTANVELRMRLQRCVQAIGKAGLADTVAAAARLLKKRRPDGAAPVLLACLPFVPDEAAEDVLDAFLHVAAVGGTVDPSVVAALKDGVPVRRAAAAIAVGCLGTAEQRTLVQRLLDDPDAGVRVRAAQGLLGAREARAVAGLVALLSQGELAWAERAHDLLVVLAGKTAPAAVLGTSAAARKKCGDAWQAWWSEHRSTLALTPADSGLNLAIAVHAAKKAVADFLQAHISRDAAILERSTDVPFRDYPEKLYTTREELHAAYKNTVPAPGLMWRILAFVTIEEQLTIAGTDEEREYLRGLPVRGLVAVHVAINEEGQNGTQALALVVRVQGARGRFIGIVDSVIRQ